MAERRDRAKETNKKKQFLQTIICGQSQVSPMANQ